MGRMQRNKGKDGERELARELSRLFGVDAHRSQQFCGSAGDSDVAGLPGVHVEVKRTETLRLWDAVEQAVEDAADGAVPVVFHRSNRRPWVAVVRLDDLPALVVKLYMTLASKGA